MKATPLVEFCDFFFQEGGRRVVVALKANLEPETTILYTWLFKLDDSIMVTPPKTNMEPEKDGFQKESPFAGVHFQVPC